MAEKISPKFEKELLKEGWTYNDDLIYTKLMQGKRYYFLLDGYVDVMPDEQREGKYEKRLTGKLLHSFLRRHFAGFLKSEFLTSHELVDKLKTETNEVLRKWVKRVQDEKKRGF